MKKLIVFFASVMMLGCIDLFDASRTKLSEYKISDTSAICATLIEGNAVTEQVIHVEYTRNGYPRRVSVYPKYNWAKFSLIDNANIQLALSDTSSLDETADTLKVNINLLE